MNVRGTDSRSVYFLCTVLKGMRYKSVNFGRGGTLRLNRFRDERFRRFRLVLCFLHRGWTRVGCAPANMVDGLGFRVWGLTSANSV